MTTLPCAGHIGSSMVHKIVPVILTSRTTLVFTNTRGQSEMWYQLLLDAAPELSGLMAIHHGAIDRELRHWIENGLAEGSLKAVICTSSLDLGVDFKPVDTVIQIGSAKGVTRFLQRAGRSDEFLVKIIQTRDSHHLFLYPFEGRLIHEVMAALLAYRISLITPITFTMAMNDYGLELLSDQPIPIEEKDLAELLNEKLIKRIERMQKM